MTEKLSTCTEAFLKWFPDFAKRQYPFYTHDAAVSATNSSLGHTLWEAWETAWKIARIRANPAPVSGEVLNIVERAMKGCGNTDYKDAARIFVGLLWSLGFEITAAKTAAPPRMKSSAAINPEDFNKPGSVVFTPDAKDSRIDFLQQQVAVLESADGVGFTREGLENRLDDALRAEHGCYPNSDGSTARNLIQTLIDIGAVRVKP